MSHDLVASLAPKPKGCATPSVDGPTGERTDEPGDCIAAYCIVDYPALAHPTLKALNRAPHLVREPSSRVLKVVLFGRRPQSGPDIGPEMLEDFLASDGDHVWWPDLVDSGKIEFRKRREAAILGRAMHEWRRDRAGLDHLVDQRPNTYEVELAGGEDRGHVAEGKQRQKLLLSALDQDLGNHSAVLVERRRHGAH